MTYLSVKVDYNSCILYRIIMQVPIFIVPFTTNFGDYIESVIKFAFPIFVFLKIYRTFLKVPMLDKIQKKEKKRSFSYIILTIILLIIVALTSDYFKYQLYVIATGSMTPNINRGDVVITKKISDQEKRELKVGEVLVFKKEDRINWKLYVDAVYKSDPSKSTFSGEVLSKLLGVKNQGGFRYLGKTEYDKIAIYVCKYWEFIRFSALVLLFQ